MSGLSRKAILGLHSPLARVVEVHEALASTQERARELARAGTPHGTLVVAGIQTGGRGRLGRLWGSPAGGLWMSFVLRPGFGASLASRITQTAAVGIAKGLWEIGVEARIKWPNDLLVGGNKICGILAESGVGQGGRLDYVILGVGMNANLDPSDLEVSDREVTTIRSELGRDVDLLILLRALLSNLDNELGRIDRLRSRSGRVAKPELHARGERARPAFRRYRRRPGRGPDQGGGPSARHRRRNRRSVRG